MPSSVPGSRSAGTKRSSTSWETTSEAGAARPSLTKSISQRVPMMAMSALTPAEMSVVSFWSSTSQGTTSIWMSVPGLAASNWVARSSK